MRDDLGVGGRGRVRRLDRVRGDERLPVVADPLDQGEPLAPHGQAEVERRDAAVDPKRHVPPLDGRLERQPLVERLHRTRAGPVLRQARRVDTQLREHRRAGVAAAELPHLPLLREHPERVAHLRAERALEALRARPALDPVPHRHRRELAPLDRGADVRDPERARHAPAPPCAP